MSYVTTLKALSDAHRLEIVTHLLHHNYCVSALAGLLNITEAAVSQHLNYLKRAGLVRNVRRGYYSHYDVNIEPIKEVINVLQAFIAPVNDRALCDYHSVGDHRYCNHILSLQSYFNQTTKQKKM